MYILYILILLTYISILPKHYHIYFHIFYRPKSPYVVCTRELELKTIPPSLVPSPLELHPLHQNPKSIKLTYYTTLLPSISKNQTTKSETHQIALAVLAMILGQPLVSLTTTPPITFL